MFASQKAWFLPRSERALKSAGLTLKEGALSEKERSACLVRTAKLCTRAGHQERAIAHLREATKLPHEHLTLLTMVQIIEAWFDLAQPNESKALVPSARARLEDEKGMGKASLRDRLDLIQMRIATAFGRWEVALLVVETSSIPVENREPKIAASILLVAGQCALNLRARKKAQMYLLESIKNAHELRLPSVAQEGSGLLAQHFLASGQTEEAVMAFLLSLSACDAAPRSEIEEPEADDRIRTTWLAIEAVAEAMRREKAGPFRTALAHRAEQLIRLVSARAELLSDDLSLRGALPRSVLTRQRILEAHVNTSRARHRRRAEKRIVPQKPSLSDLVDSSVSLIVRKDDRREYDDQLQQAEERLVSFRAATCTQYPLYAVLSGIPATDSVPLEKRESTDLVLSFLSSQYGGFLFAWRDRELTRVVTLPREDLLRQWVGKMLDATPERSQNGLDLQRESTGHLLARTLFSEITPHLKDDDRITFVMSGVLLPLILDRLPDPHDPKKRLVGQRFQTRYAFSSVPSPPRSKKGLTKVLAVVDPDYTSFLDAPSDSTGDSPPDSESENGSPQVQSHPEARRLNGTDLNWGILPHLHQGCQEIKALTPFWKKPEVLTGAEATKAALATLAPHCDILHLRTVLIDDPEEPARAGLALTQVGPGCGDGFLWRKDILSLRLNAGLVVLSLTDEGVRVTRRDLRRLSFRLARAFLLAGAETILAPVDLVSPECNVEFLSSFYRELERTHDPEKALFLVRKARAEQNARVPYVLFGGPCL